MRDATLSDLERLDAIEADVAFEMDEESFRAFYERTARGLWIYLSRITGDRQAADDLLQEAYYRFLRAGQRWETESHRRAYLFRIATNLARDRHRRRRGDVQLTDSACGTIAAPGGNVADLATCRTDLQRAMAKLRPRDRALLWLAYAQEHPHAEIAETLGVRTASVKLLLFRARRRLASLLRGTRHTHARGTDRG